MTSLCVIEHGTDDNGVPIVQEAETGYLCRTHRRKLTRLTDEIGTLWCELNLVLDGSAPRDATPKTRRVRAPEAPAPIDLTAASLRDPRSKAARLPLDQSEPIPAAPIIVASWVLLLLEERELKEMRHKLIIRRNRALRLAPYVVPMRGPRGIIGQLDLLARHHDWIAAQPWVDDYLRELQELRKALAGAVHDHPVQKIGRCDLPTDDGPRCGGTLLAENGSGVWRCAGCDARWVTAQEQARLAVRLDSQGGTS